MSDPIAPGFGPEDLEAGAFNLGPRISQPMHGDQHWLSRHWYEIPRDDPEWPDVYTYTDAMSYAPGEEIAFHSSTTAPQWGIRIYRDGAEPELIHAADNLTGRHFPTPVDAYKAGCGWPVAYCWRLPLEISSGFYKVLSYCSRPDGGRFVQHHFFVVRPLPGKTSAAALMILPTATWTAYNDWGGANYYLGRDGADGASFSPTLSLERPWTRGIVWLPPEAPRVTSARPAPWTPPRYAFKEWAFANGFGQSYAAAGWAQYDRHFMIWAERQGLRFDMITQTDLQLRPELLDQYQCTVIVGHDEYWTREMRTNLEAYVDKGGRVARFGANFIWQIRLEDDGRKQVCYKYRAAAEDPIRDTAEHNLLTSAWEDKAVNWPGATTFGVNGFRGVYASWGGFTPRGTRGFTVYRPDHWVFEGTDLYYGDVFGSEAEIFGYEVDGLDYTFRNGLPYPTHDDGAPTSVEILAMSPASMYEKQYDGPGFRYYVGNSDMNFRAQVHEGSIDAEALEKHRHGAGMLVHMHRGKGEVITAGSCEWVMGLTRNDFFTQTITRNILERWTTGPLAR